MRREADDSRVNLYSQIGFLVTAALAVVLALFFRSAVDLWHDVGSVGVPALLVALGSSYRPRLRMRPTAAAWCIAVSGATSLGWLLSRSHAGNYPLSIEPIYVGLAVSMLFWIGDRLTRGARNAGQ